MFETDKLPLLEAARVSLRHLEESDIDALFEIFSDEEAMRYWSCAAFAEKAQAAELLRGIHDSFKEKTLFQWGVAQNSDNRIIGTVTLFNIDKENRRAEIGYALNRRFWGQGLINEALKTLINQAFSNWDFNRIEADVDPHNTASIRTLEKLGFQKEGFLRERWFVNGQVQDAFFYGLLKKDWVKMENP